MKGWQRSLFHHIKFIEDFIPQSIIVTIANVYTQFDYENRNHDYQTYDNENPEGVAFKNHDYSSFLKIDINLAAVSSGVILPRFSRMLAISVRQINAQTGIWIGTVKPKSM